MIKLRIFCLQLAACCLLLSACAHPALDAREMSTATVSKVFATDANEAYRAVSWALKTNGYAIANEDLQNGIVTSGWRSTTADSHYLDVFGHKDYGVNGAYYKLDVKIMPEGGTSSTRVEISSAVKTMTANLRSSKIEERKILNKVADYLRKSDIRVTNVGIEE